MTLNLPWEQTEIQIALPDNCGTVVLEPNEVPVCSDANGAVYEALFSGGWDEFIKAPGKLLVIVNDGTRPTPTRTVLEILADELDAAGAEFIVATGVHRAPTETELEYIFGSTLERFRSCISAHNARTDETFVIGTTSRGTEVKLNSKVRQAERVLIIGSVEPHYFAGYTGGRKGLLPGVAAYSTIEQNHKLALSPRAQTLALHGNPVHEDMLEACRLIDKNVLTIMTVLDRNQNLYGVTAGGLEDAFDAAVQKADEVFVVPLKQQADAVIACAKYPMDIDLYQSQKAIENAKLALKSGGTLILVSACRDGIGEDTFRDLLASCPSPEAVYSKIEAGYRLGYHKAAKIAEICSKANVAAFTGLDSDVLKSVFINPVENLQQTVDELISVNQGNTKFLLAVMPDASVTVPHLQNS
ncbi:MAG: nickel-dependent lactate racemase [Spirochaetales bacterium]|uniref:Nickel-dependent lactate racemase n=1 Tax=Candidatus Thalassospirochaeta sargassi TaxID=3119039 RepID=A0AAJ1MJ12_9SPIO|nr:nickel-dependent lactate racemase [Spirochaetales bacterium]